MKEFLQKSRVIHCLSDCSKVKTLSEVAITHRTSAITG